MSVKIAKKALKTKIGRGLATHGLAASAGAVAGSATAFSLVNFDPHQRRENKKMRRLQRRFNNKVSQQIKEALEEKGYRIDKKGEK